MVLSIVSVLKLASLPLKDLLASEDTNAMLTPLLDQSCTPYFIVTFSLPVTLKINSNLFISSETILSI